MEKNTGVKMNLIRSFILAILLIMIAQTIKGETYFEPINPRLNVSPAQVQYSSLALGIVGTALVIIRPSISRPLVYIPEIDKKHNFDMPSWAYNVGDKGAKWIVGVPYLYYLALRPKYSWEKAFVYSEALLMMHGSVTITKYSFGRKRPGGGNNLSFPSGHTAQAFTAASWIATDLYRTYKDTPMKYVYATVPYAFAGFVGASRIGGKKHYFTDVLVGGSVGTLIGYAMYSFHFDESGKLRKQHMPLVMLNADPLSSSYMLSATLSF